MDFTEQALIDHLEDQISEHFLDSEIPYSILGKALILSGVRLVQMSGIPSDCILNSLRDALDLAQHRISEECDSQE